MTNTTNGFDDFDTQVTAEEFYEVEQDYFRELAEDQQVQDDINPMEQENA